MQIKRLRLERMECVAHSWKSKSKNRKMLADLRGRDRDLWSDRERGDYRKSEKEARNKMFDSVLEEPHDEHEAGMLTMSRQLDISTTVVFSDDVNSGLARFHNNLPQHATTSHNRSRSQVLPIRMGSSEVKMASKLKTAKRSKEGGDGDSGDTGVGSRGDEDEMTSGSEDGSDSNDDNDDENDFFAPEDGASGWARPQHLDPNIQAANCMDNADRYISSRQMSKDQDSVVNVMKSHFQALNDGTASEDGYEAPILLITGGPGVGKSYVVHTLAGLAKEMDAGDQVRMAYIGIAAVGIDGFSACSLMDIPTDFDKASMETVRNWNKDRLENFKAKFDVTKISCVVFDEISTVKPEVLGYINHRLQEATQCRKPFGGLAMIMLGDFDQMKPVGASRTIPATIMKREADKKKKLKSITKRDSTNQVTTVGRNGLEVFKKARHMRLEQQHRSLDEDHTDLLVRMSRGEALTVKDLDNYKILGEGDGGDADFKFATILVSCNDVATSPLL